MSEDKRNLVEGLLREMGGGGGGGSGGGGSGGGADTSDGADISELTGKLEKMGFTTADVTAAMRVTGGGSGGGGRDSTDTALDWLCLNVPEVRLPRCGGAG